MTNKKVIDESWNSFHEEYAKSYLHDADLVLPIQLTNYIFSNFENPTIVDVGCGNARLYSQFLNTGKQFNYCGFDISQPLINAANQNFGDRQNFKCEIGRAHV